MCVCIMKGGGGMYGERKGSKGKGAVRREQEGNSGKKGKSHVFCHMWSLFPPSVCVGMDRKRLFGGGTERREWRKGNNDGGMCCVYLWKCHNKGLETWLSSRQL